MGDPDEIIIPVNAPPNAGRELARGGTFFLGLVATVSGLNGLLLLIGRKDQGRSVLIFSASLWLVFFAIRIFRRNRDRQRTARPEGQIRLTATSISVPVITGEVRTLRWIDVKQARMTRDVSGNVFYEIEGIVLQRSRVRDPETLDRELASRVRNFERTFEWEKTPAQLPPPPGGAVHRDIPPGERFDLRLPATGWQNARGCGGLILAVAIVFGLALAFPDDAITLLKSRFGFMIMTGALILGIFLASRPRKAWIVAAADGLHIHARDFPSFIPWSDLRDYTIVSTGGRNPRRNLTIWTSAGSWKLDGIRIRNEERFKTILGERRK